MELTKKQINKLKNLQANADIFSEQVIGSKLWNKQKEILKAVSRDNYIAIGSGHKTGKTFILADIVLWYLTCFPQSKVVTTAPTGRQVRDLLWSEITSKYNRIQHIIGGRGLTQRIEIAPDWFAVGFKSEDYDPNAFQGYHSKTGHTLVIFDEACGIPKSIWEAAASIADKWVVAGNRLSPLSEFEKKFASPEWKSIVISSLESPNLTGEMSIMGLTNEQDIKMWEDQYRRGSPLWQAHVEGLCPIEGLDTLISLKYLLSIEKEKEEIKPVRPFYGGLDVAEMGSDLCVFTILDARGQHIDSIRWSKTKLTATQGRAKKIIKERKIRKTVIDADGLGLGVYQILADELPGKIVAYRGQSKSYNENYYNKKTELWHWLKNDLEDGNITAIQRIGNLFEDLTGVKSEITTKGKLALEPKKKYKSRIGRSPDDGDSFVFANAARKLDSIKYPEKTNMEEEPDLPEQFVMSEFAEALEEFE